MLGSFWSVFRVPFFTRFSGTPFGPKTEPRGSPLGVTLGTFFVFFEVLFGVPLFASIFDSFLTPRGEEKVVFSIEGLSKIDVRPFQER